MKSHKRGNLIFIKGVDPKASNTAKLSHIFKVIRTNYKDFYWWRTEILRYVFEIYSKKWKGNNGIYVLEEKWDNLIILDACRYDVLKEVMGERIGYRISRGSSTLEWIKEHFSGAKCHNIVYVTSNPWINRIASDAFYKVIPVWKDGWDEDLGTVHPKTTTEYAKEAAKRYPDKRLIIHYMQPHVPYIVENDLPKRPMLELAKGKLNPLDVWAVYKKSLEATLPYVYELIENLQGRTVISSDHGELFDKKVLFYNFAGHPWGLHVPELIQVPWVVYKSGAKGPREEPTQRQELKNIIERLKDERRI